MSYSHSVASDGTTLSSAASFANTPLFVAQVKPSPEYISLTSASQLATDIADSRADQDHTWRRTSRAAVAETALSLVNAFLDRQLYEYMNVAKTTNLALLKPAVTDVLKKNLARDAIASAHENLQDLLALQADDEPEHQGRPHSQAGSRWNLEFTWKRSRLRVMMRTEKSEFDIEDDERYVREESLSTTFSETAGVISLASEIFLAGILDYLGDMLLSQATQLAIARTQRRGSTSTLSADPNEPTYILVQEIDVERAALNSPLDRQWRAWRKSLRSLQRNSQQSNSAANSPVVRRGSLWDRLPDQPENHYPEHILAANIPLPTSQRDVDEIEVPGLAKDPDRPQSAMQSFSRPLSNRPQSAGFGANRQSKAEKSLDKLRPFSLPVPILTPSVDVPGAWPGATPVEEIIDPVTQYAEGQAGEGLPTVDNLDSERPESRDSADTEKLTPVSSKTASLDDLVPPMRAAHRPKRLAIYGPSSSRYTQAYNLSSEDLQLSADLDRPFSPDDFLASRNLHTSPSALTPPAEDIKSRSFEPPAELAAEPFEETDLDSNSEEDNVALTAVSSPGAEKASLHSPLSRQFPGLGLSRSGSDASSRRTPVHEQRVSADFVKSRRTSKLTDSDASSPGKRGSLRQIVTNRDSLDERRRLPTSSLTSEQEFDLLIKSGETVKYTLTPETVRDVPDRSVNPHVRVQKQTLFRSGSKENCKKDSDGQSVRSMRSTTFSMGGKDKKDRSSVEESRRKTSISRPTPQNTSALPSGQTAREPVMQTESTRDFADFIRSTGPDKEPNPVIPALAASRSMSSLRTTASAQAVTLTNAPPVPNLPVNPGGKYIPRSPLGPPPKRSANRPSLLARAATGSSDNNSDLIDFIRSGPPGAGGKTRVPNHIAPFADWDDEDGGDLRTTVTGASDMPRPPASMYNRPQTSSSSNSRTGLLPNTSSKYNPPSLPTLPLTQQTMPSLKLLLPNVRSAPSNPDPTQRKRSRIKDPYAIPGDSDYDDEEDELGDLPADRVNDSFGGGAQVPQATSNMSPAVAGAEKSGANSVTSLHSSAGRASPSMSNGKTPILSQGVSPGELPKPGYEPSIASVRSATSTTAIRPAHITSQISSNGYIPRSNKPKLEMRSAGVAKNARLDPFHSSGTSDLADFLRDSGPPEPPARRAPEPAPAPTVGARGKPERKKGPKFWQRKATYLDMP